MKRRVVPCVECGRQIQIGKRLENHGIDDPYCDSCARIDTVMRANATKEARALSDRNCIDCGNWLTWSEVEATFTTCASCAADRRECAIHGT